MFKFFDRYILKEVTPPFFVGLLVYSFVLLMNQVFLLAELFIAKGVSFGTVSRIFMYLIPSVLAFTIPMSILMGILAGLSRLSSDSEVVAFKTLGISNRRLLWPILAFALGGWLATSYLTLYLAPRANYKWVQTLAQSVLTRVQFRINAREFNETIPHTVIFIQDISQDNTWENVFVYLSPPEEEPKAILAKEGRLNFYPELKRATLELFDGQIHAGRLVDSEDYSVASFEKFEREINVESLFTAFSQEKRVREKDIAELAREAKIIRKDLDELERKREILTQTSAGRQSAELETISSSLRERNRNYRSHWVEIHKKFALPVVCLIFVLVGIPLGVSTKKGGRTSGFTVSLGIILVYYILITAGEKMAMDGKISPFLGMWGPNGLFFLMGILLFIQSAKESSLFSRAAGFLKKKPSDEYSEAAPVKRFAWSWPRLSVPFPNIIDRYVLRKYTAIFTLVFLGLLLISVIVTFFERIDNVYEHNKSLLLLFEYIQYRMPEFIHYILPVAALTTTLLTFGLLTKFNEITAMKACGISLYRLILSVVFVGILVSGFSFYLQENLLPYANKKAEETWNRINDFPARSYGYLDRRWVLSRNKERIYHYSYFEPSASVFSHLSILDIDLAQWSFKRRMYAEKGMLQENRMTLVNGWVRDFREGSVSRYEKVKETALSRVEPADYFLKEWKEPSLMNYRELKAYTGEIEEMGFETTRFKVDLLSKLSFPFACLIMTLLGIPFAFSMGKRGALFGIGLSVVIAMIYWGTLGVFKSLGYVDFLSAFLAAWGPNLIFGPASLFLLFRMRT